jgi:hypothetical protein
MHNGNDVGGFCLSYSDGVWDDMEKVSASRSTKWKGVSILSSVNVFFGQTEGVSM